MEVFVTIPVPIHSGLLGRCGRESWQFELLKNGLFSKAADGEDIVVIACSPDEANEIVTWATKYYPDDMTRITVSNEPPVG